MRRTKETKQSKSGLYVGIDPGQYGAIAAINARMEIIMLEDWPGDEVEVARLVWDLDLKNPTHAAIERTHSMPEQGIASSFKFGSNFGIWRMAMAMLSIPFCTVSVQQWQKGVIQKAQDKTPAMTAAGRLFPSAKLYGPKGGKKDGRADALLIAYWCMRNFGGGI